MDQAEMWGRVVKVSMARPEKERGEGGGLGSEIAVWEQVSFHLCLCVWDGGGSRLRLTLWCRKGIWLNMLGWRRRERGRKRTGWRILCRGWRDWMLLVQSKHRMWSELNRIGNDLSKASQKQAGVSGGRYLHNSILSCTVFAFCLSRLGKQSTKA